MEIFTGGIYYFTSQLQFNDNPLLKILIYICEINGSPVFAKINTDSYHPRDEVDIKKANYPTNNTIMYDCYLDCSRLIRNNITISDFLCLPSSCFRGKLTTNDLREAKERFRLAKTISNNDKSIITAAIDKQLNHS